MPPEVIPPGKSSEVEEEVTDLATTDAEIADRSHMVATARRFPRSITKFRQQVSGFSRLNQQVAQEMMYSLPRAGKQLVGPSTRFAEVVASCWGNNRVGEEIIGIEGDFIVAEGRFYDCENNFGKAVRIKRRITDKDGRRFNADMIGVTGIAAASIASRNAVFKGIPKALWADLFEQAKQTAVGSAASISQQRDEMLKLFNGLGITDTMILNVLEVQGKADIGAEELLAMRSWHKQLQERICTLEDIFGSPADAEIDLCFEKLGWNATKQRLSRESYRGRRDELLAYVKGLVAQQEKATGATSSPVEEKPKKKGFPPKEQPKAEERKDPPPPSPEAQPSEVQPEAKSEPSEKKEEAKPPTASGDNW